MAAAKPANELKALQERVAELEKQLRDLRALVDAKPAPQQYWPNRPRTEEEETAFHEGSQWVQEYIRKQREADIKRINAAMDRQEARERKAVARPRKSPKARAKARKAG
jgi:hypothetical protein